MKETRSRDNKYEVSANGSRSIRGQTALNGACSTDKTVAASFSIRDKMKRLICIIFIILLMPPLFAEEFKLKRTFNDKPIFNALQFTACILNDMDTICTYKSIWFHRLREANPFWKNKIDKPGLVFALDLVIKTGIIWGTSKLYKKSKVAAYVVVIVLNVVSAYAIYQHLSMWKKYPSYL